MVWLPCNFESIYGYSHCELRYEFLFSSLLINIFIINNWNKTYRQQSYIIPKKIIAYSGYARSSRWWVKSKRDDNIPEVDRNTHIFGRKLMKFRKKRTLSHFMPFSGQKHFGYLLVLREPIEFIEIWNQSANMWSCAVSDFLVLCTRLCCTW